MRAREYETPLWRAGTRKGWRRVLRRMLSRVQPEPGRTQEALVKDYERGATGFDVIRRPGAGVKR
jgi:hypothetical protein